MWHNEKRCTTGQPLLRHGMGRERPKNEAEVHLRKAERKQRRKKRGQQGTKWKRD
jgi:hypothetical protein